MTCFTFCRLGWCRVWWCRCQPNGVRQLRSDGLVSAGLTRFDQRVYFVVLSLFSSQGSFYVSVNAGRLRFKQNRRVRLSSRRANAGAKACCTGGLPPSPTSPPKCALKPTATTTVEATRRRFDLAGRRREQATALGLHEQARVHDIVSRPATVRPCARFWLSPTRQTACK